MTEKRKPVPPPRGDDGPVPDRSENEKKEQLRQFLERLDRYLKTHGHEGAL